MVPKAIGLRRVPIGEEMLEHRLIMGELEWGPESKHRVLVASAYWEHGRRLPQIDADILHQMRLAKAQYGDWNKEALGMELLAPRRADLLPG